jgi:hypothetical protein
MKPWIQNVSLSDIKNGYHYDTGPNSLLIQIVDPGTEFPIPKYNFNKIIQLKFLDVEHHDGLVYNDAITENDAIIITEALKMALENCMNVVVHCHAGICRSGAVAEVGVMMGFRDAESFRAPNLLVKRKLLEQLGMAFEDTQHTINGNPIPEDWTNDNEKVFILAEARRKLREENQ